MSTTAANKKTGSSAGKKRPLPRAGEPAAIVPLLLPSLYRLTEGLPRRELKLMVSEATASEEALVKEIQDLQEALENPGAPLSQSVEAMLESELTPVDRYFTVSALLGRLRDDMATPLPPNSTLPALREKTGLLQPQPKKKTKKEKEGQQQSTPTGAPNEPPAASTVKAIPTVANTSSQPAVTETAKPSPPLSALDKHKRVLSLYQSSEYTKEHAQPAALLALWKRISAHRSAAVFRRSVNPKEAPGYAERILFPMDLNLIRKMIIARQIKSYSQLHQRLGLICHNCVKYNGRESDYAVVARDFESTVDELIVGSVAAATEVARQQAQKAVAHTAATKPSSAAKPAVTTSAKKPSTNPSAKTEKAATPAPTAGPAKPSAVPSSTAPSSSGDVKQTSTAPVTKAQVAPEPAAPAPPGTDLKK